jgi:CHASE2 domain-containing sensor protein
MGPDLGADPRLLIVDMTSDFKDISDQDLVEILPRLTRYQPRAIGITLQRDEISTFTPESRAALQKIYQKNNNIFGSCEHADSDNKRAGFTFIPSPSTSLGFSNSPLDEDKFLRRHLLIYRNLPEDECAATASFSLVIAHHYFKSKYKYNKNIPTYNLEKAQFENLELRQGAYHSLKMEEFKNLFQIMIDYRSRNISEIVPIKQILIEDFSSVRDRIVLIGRASNRDALQLTPYGTLVEMSGVEITGQLISQLIDAAEGTRPILKPATFTLDFIWIVCVSCLGGFIGWRVSSPIGQVIVLLTLPTALVGVCFLLFVTQGLWLGSVSITIVAVIANFSVFLYNRYISTKLWGMYEYFKYHD